MKFALLKETACQLWRQKRNLLLLVRNDFTQNYVASYLGFMWAIVGPLVTLLVLTLVFQLGFRVPPINAAGVPFPVWLACGMVPWVYFADGLMTGAGAVTSYSFLVRKASFRISFLPGIRLASAGIIHLALMLFLVGLLLWEGISPSWHWLQWLVYAGLMFLFLLGTAWCTSAISIFVPDITSVLGILTTLGFWATPIFWNPIMLPQKWHWVFVVNPAYYLVQGYRDTFIEHRWLWERPLMENGIFALWLFTVLCLGSFTFKRLRPHFADVL